MRCGGKCRGPLAADAGGGGPRSGRGPGRLASPSTLWKLIPITMNAMKDLLKWFALHSAESLTAVVAVIGGLWIILGLSDNLYVCLPALALFETAMLWLAIWVSRRR